MWPSSFPSTVYWRGFLFSIVCIWLLCQKLFAPIHVFYFWTLNSVPLVLYLFFCQYHAGFFFKMLFIYFFRERGREGEREAEKHQCVRETLNGSLLHTSNWGLGPQPRHVPWPRMEPVTFWIAGNAQPTELNSQGYHAVLILIVL